jgi:hypothetical protein
MALITLTEARDIRRISENYDTDEFDPFVNEIQKYYLLPLLGVELYEDVVANPAAANNARLLEGETYTYGSRKYNFKGVKEYLIYLFFYKYSLEGQVKYTDSGRQNVEVDFATKSQRGIDAQVISNFIDKANLIGEETRLFLERNSADFPLYKSGEASDIPNKDYKFDVVGHTYRKSRVV